MSYELAEIERRLANLIRLGTVEQADYDKARVRVRCGELLTGWLPWLTARAGNDRSWWAPEVDEQVMVFSPSGDIAQGVVLAAIYQQRHPANGKDPDLCRVDFEDGASVEYNRQSHEMTIHSKGELFIRADGDIWLDAKNIHAFERE